MCRCGSHTLLILVPRELLSGSGKDLFRSGVVIDAVQDGNQIRKYEYLRKTGPGLRYCSQMPWIGKMNTDRFPADHDRSYLITIVFLLISAMLFSGCAQQTRKRTDYQSLPLVKPNNRHGVVPEYKLGYGDVVEIKFFNNKQFNELVAVRPDGRITIEKVGDVYVAGMTPSQLDSLITATYATIIINPEVTVFVRKFGGYKVYVLGEVNSPGGYDLERDMTVLQAFAAAGGLKTSASLPNTMVLRQGRKGALEVYKIDISEYLYNENTYLSTSDLYLQPQDVVFANSTALADASTFFRQIWDILIPPATVYLQALWWAHW